MMNNEDESYATKKMIHVNVVKTTNNINMFKKAEERAYNDSAIPVEKHTTASKFKNVKKSCATKKKGLRIRELGEDFPVDSIKSEGKLVYICRVCHENFMSMRHIYCHLERHSENAWKSFYKLARNSIQIGDENHDQDVKVVLLTTKFLYKWEMKKGKRSRRLSPGDVNLYKANNVQNSRGGCLGSRVVDFVNENIQRAAETLMLLATQDYKSVSKTSMTRRKVEDSEVGEDMLEAAESLVLISRGHSSSVVEPSLRVEDGTITSGGGSKMIHDFDLNEEPSMECD